MGFFSSLRKNKQEPTADEGEFLSHAAEASQAMRGRSKRKQKDPESDSSDLVLPEKKRARRRLVGALALVLAAVIGLPMILNSEPKSLSDDIAIQIPSKDKLAAPSERQPLAVWPNSAIGGSQSEVPAKAPEPVAVTPAAQALATPTPPPVSGATDASRAVKSVEPAKVEVTPLSPAKSAVTAEVAPIKAPIKLEKPSDNKAAAKANPKADEAAHAMAMLDGKSDDEVKPAHPAAEKKGKYAIQVAALSSKEKINELQSRLKTIGFQSYTQKVATKAGQSTRIRVGPFASKDEAEKMRAKLIKAGLNGTVLPPTQ